MAAAAGIAAFLLALLLSYQIFPDPGTGSQGYALGRFIFTVAATVIVSVVVGKSSKKKQEAKQQLETEDERRREREESEERRTLARRELDHEEGRRFAALQGARARVDHLRSVLQRRDQQQRDCQHRLGRFAYGVVADEFIADVVWDQLLTPLNERTLITAEQMELLTGDLNIVRYRNQRGLLELEGLQYATNLKGLAITTWEDRLDLGPLAGLVNLRRLRISHGQGVLELDALATLVGLHDLTLESLTNVTDFRPLAGLESLTRLALISLTKSLEFDSISGLTGLTKLEVKGMAHFRDLTGISNLAPLTELMLVGLGDLDDLTPLRRLSRLKKLSLCRAHMSGGSRKFEGLAGITPLMSLVLRELTGVADLKWLANVSQLQALEITDVRLDPYKYEIGSLDLDPLKGLTSLATLKLAQDGYTSFKNWQAISYLPSLDELDVSADICGTDAIDAISRVSRLATLRISCAFLPDLEPIAALSQLKCLRLEGKWGDDGPSRLRDLTKLSSLRTLTSLSLDTLAGRDLVEDVGKFTSLTHLELRKVDFCGGYEDLRPLTALTQLQSIVLYENFYLVKDLAPLGVLPRLTKVTLAKSHEGHWDYSPLRDVSGLAIELQ